MSSEVGPIAPAALAAPAEDVLIEARDLGKVYQLYNRPQDRLKQAFLWGRKKLYRDFWALHSVSFELRRGEMLGIIGRNGSGKSTLLQILAGVLQPTGGSLAVRGRVAALLELGSGFNPDYTGRENVYLNGAILGITRAEMAKRFEQIADFAEIGQFIDQPVKTYSSGMFVRLAFAVTTCVDADILLIDEALAVGDVFFRQKCYERLQAIRRQGTSIVLVSHAMTDVEQFCSRCILLHHGHALFQGSSSEAVKRYYLIEQEDRLAAIGSTPTSETEAPAPPTPVSGEEEFWPEPGAMIDLTSASQVSTGAARCTGLAICDEAGRAARLFRQGETASVFHEYEVLIDLEVPIGGMVLRTDKGIAVHGRNTLQYDTPLPTRVPKGSRLRFRQDVMLDVAAGEYTLEVGLATIAGADFARRHELPYEELNSKCARLCHLPSATYFAVTLAGDNRGQLRHHGLANLPGQCRVTLHQQGKP